MQSREKKRRAILISFSGIDGAGKGTQIDAVCARLRADGQNLKLIRFWDDIARLTQLRETAGHRVFKGDKGVGSPSTPINRRDKNVRTWFMSLVRLFLYFLDALATRHVVRKAQRSGADVVICDRYVYDEFANLSLTNPANRLYVRLMMMLVPKPEISYLLDADPVEARARKPEYPLEFLYFNRQAYLTLSRIVGGMTVIAPMPIAEVSQRVLMHLNGSVA
jgi:thymidylate kinase